MRCEKNGFAVGNGILIWSGDKYKCPNCDAEVVVKFAGKPYVNGLDPFVYEREMHRLLSGPVVLGLELEE
jgi:hypothetical protein